MISLKAIRAGLRKRNEVYVTVYRAFLLALAWPESSVSSTRCGPSRATRAPPLGNLFTDSELLSSGSPAIQRLFLVQNPLLKQVIYSEG